MIKVSSGNTSGRMRTWAGLRARAGSRQGVGKKGAAQGWERRGTSQRGRASAMAGDSEDSDL